MNDMGLAVGGLVLGALISFVISWYFFRKSVNKRLSVYLQFASQVLAGVNDPLVRKSLEIHYRGSKIDDLLQLQYVIVNEGQRAIRDLLEPLSITLPRGVKLLEARIPHVEPKGREVVVDTMELPNGRTKVRFIFKLLNKGEFFFVNMLINGSVNHDKLAFNIGVDDLPPSISPKKQPFGTVSEPPRTGIDAFLLGLIPLAISLATIAIFYDATVTHPSWLPGSDGFSWISMPTLIVLGTLAGIVYWLALAVRSIVMRGLLGSNKRFQIPSPPSDSDLAFFYGGPYPERELAWEVMHKLRQMPPPLRRRIMAQLEIPHPRARFAPRASVIDAPSEPPKRE